MCRHVPGILIHLLNTLIPEALQIAKPEYEPRDWEQKVFLAHQALRDNISPVTNQLKVLAIIRASNVGAYYGSTLFSVTVRGPLYFD